MPEKNKKKMKKAVASKSLSLFKIPIFPNLWMQAGACVLVALKCMGVIEIPWLVAVLPLWISFAIAVFCFAVFFASISAIAAGMLLGSLAAEFTNFLRDKIEKLLLKKKKKKKKKI